MNASDAGLYPGLRNVRNLRPHQSPQRSGKSSMELLHQLGPWLLSKVCGAGARSCWGLAGRVCAGRIRHIRATSHNKLARDDCGNYRRLESAPAGAEAVFTFLRQYNAR